MASSYQNILFDWDGNLAKTLDVWVVALRKVLESRNHVLSDHQIAMTLGAVEEALTNMGIPEADKILAEAISNNLDGLHDVELYPEVLDVLTELSGRGKSLALITSSNRYMIERLLKKYALDKYFAVIITRDDVSKHKPDPEALNQAMRLMKASSDNTVMVGDSHFDIIAAQNAGVDSVLFHSKDHVEFYNLAELKFHRPTYVIEKLSELKQIVK